MSGKRTSTTSPETRASWWRSQSGLARTTWPAFTSAPRTWRWRTRGTSTSWWRTPTRTGRSNWRRWIRLLVCQFFHALFQDFPTLCLLTGRYIVYCVNHQLLMKNPFRYENNNERWFKVTTALLHKKGMPSMPWPCLVVIVTHHCFYITMYRGCSSPSGCFPLFIFLVPKYFSNLLMFVICPDIGYPREIVSWQSQVRIVSKIKLIAP